MNSKPLSGRILEAAIAVHTALGPGFLESVYQKAMEVVLRHREISFDSQKEIHVFSRAKTLDFIGLISSSVMRSLLS